MRSVRGDYCADRSIYRDEIRVQIPTAMKPTPAAVLSKDGDIDFVIRSPAITAKKVDTTSAVAAARNTSTLVTLWVVVNNMVAN